MLQKRISLEQATTIIEEVAIQTAEETITRVMVATSKINVKNLMVAGALATIGKVAENSGLETISDVATGTAVVITGVEGIKLARNIANCKDEDVETFLSEYNDNNQEK